MVFYRFNCARGHYFFIAVAVGCKSHNLPKYQGKFGCGDGDTLGIAFDLFSG